MSKRSELKGIVRNLRKYLAWQATDRISSGIVPAPEADREAFQTARSRREKARVEKVKSALKDAAETREPGRAPTPEQPVKRERGRQPDKETPSETPAGDDSAPWKKYGSRPRPTFSDRKDEAKKESPVTANDAFDDSEDMTAEEKLKSLRAFIGDCTRCGLHTGRNNIVFGVGDPEARVMIVGEAPGYNEDRQGEPFVGRSGALLDKMIGAMGIKRNDVYIANVLKCRPPDDRDPAPDEVRTCGPFLRKQVEAVEPEVIITVGRFASNLLTGNNGALGRIRGTWQEFSGIPLMPTYHPAYLLRFPKEKRKTWNDLKKVMEKLDIEIPEEYR